MGESDILELAHPLSVEVWFPEVSAIGGRGALITIPHE